MATELTDHQNYTKYCNSNANNLVFTNRNMDYILKRKRNATLSKMVVLFFFQQKIQPAIMKSLCTVICLAYSTKIRPL